VADGEAASRSQARRIWLVLFDTSGSMNERLNGRDTKYAVARRQLDRLLSTFQDGVDQMAVAPFDSRRVAERIRDARFETTKAAIASQMDGLQPRPQGNTALFSAVIEALRKVQPLASGDAQVSVVVFTDGKNDVGHAGDDPGLLAGDAGLRAATALAAEVGVTVYTIGYGSPGVSFDEAALQALKFPAASSNYFSVADETRLTQVFDSIVRKDAQLITLLVGPLPVRREQLSGQSVTFAVSSGRLSGESPAWLGNPLAPPAFEGAMTRSERETWVRGQRPGADAPLNPVFMRMIVLFAYGGLLAVLWFALPRVIWPDRYIPKPAMRSAAARPPQRAPARPAAQPAPGRGPTGRSDATAPGARSPARPAPPAERGREAPPPRPREQPPAPPRSRDAWNSRDARDSGDATVFIPPSKKPGGQS
jgi:Ca-activated chloride channel family protein